MMCLLASCKKKYEKKYLFASFKSIKKEVGSGDESGSPDPLFTGIRIRIKMSWIPNTAYGYIQAKLKKPFIKNAPEYLFICNMKR